jgi:hypothetical protein
MLNATKKELVKDFQSALEFDQSTMFRKVYEEEFGTFGGAPFGALIGDFEITRQPEDMYFIEQMSHVAAAARAVHLGRLAGTVWPGKLQRAGQAARPVESVRHGGIRQVEVVPRIRRLALRRPDAAALPRPPAIQSGRWRHRGRL